MDSCLCSDPHQHLPTPKTADNTVFPFSVRWPSICFLFKKNKRRRDWQEWFFLGLFSCNPNRSQVYALAAGWQKKRKTGRQSAERAHTYFWQDSNKPWAEHCCLYKSHHYHYESKNTCVRVRVCVHVCLNVLLKFTLISIYTLMQRGCFFLFDRKIYTMKILFWTFSDNLFLDWEEEEVYCSLQSMDRKNMSFNIIGVM